MSAEQPFATWNGRAVPASAVPQLPFPSFQSHLDAAVRAGGRITTLFGITPPDTSQRTPAAVLFAVLAPRSGGPLSLLSTRVEGSYPTLSIDLPQVHLFEREIHEQCGVIPAGHPNLAPVRQHAAYQDEAAPGVFPVAGTEVHEVAVGPVHAGVIEPGHFRFQCHGERVLQLDIVLGYQHRGIERALVGAPHLRSRHYAETLAGDTTAGHATAYAELIEALAETPAPPRADAVRALALELERIANHVGDLGALAGDAGYLPTASFCGRIRGDFLELTAELSGSRFARNLIRPGGVAVDLDADMARRLRQRIDAALRDVEGSVALLWDSPSVRARFDDIGVVAHEVAVDLGMVGPAARASGLPGDVRRDQPSGIYRFAQMHGASLSNGDVFARAFLRWLEIQYSVTFLRDLLSGLPEGPPHHPLGPMRPNTCAVSFVEGWRGEIVHMAFTDERGQISHYKVVDPSFHNWMGLSMALRDQQISDFPLCNKSFNLSYCGHDL